jgi:hypothetical protein
MAVTQQVITPDTFFTSAASSLTSGSTTVSGSDKELLVFVLSGDGSPTTPSNVKWQGSGGTALSQVGSTVTFSSFYYLSAWHLPGPNSASSTVYADWGGTQNIAALGGVNYTGTNGIGTPASNSGSFSGGATSGTASVTVSTTAGDFVIAAAAIGNSNTSTNPTATPGAGLTDVYQVEGAQCGFMALQIVSTVASGSSTVMSVDFANAEANSPWGIIAFVINAAAGPSASKPLPKSAAMRVSPYLFF